MMQLLRNKLKGGPKSKPLPNDETESY